MGEVSIIAGELEASGSCPYMINVNNAGEGDDATVLLTIALGPEAADITWHLKPEAAEELGEFLRRAAAVAAPSDQADTELSTRWRPALCPPTEYKRVWIAYSGEDGRAFTTCGAYDPDDKIWWDHDVVSGSDVMPTHQVVCWMPLPDAPAKGSQ